MTRHEIDVERRVFVVGVPRAGTTLVQTLLASHTEMTSFTESHFFSRHYSLLPLVHSPILTKDPEPRLREFLAENGVDASEVDALLDEKLRRPAGMRLFSALYAREVGRRFLRVLDELARRRGESNWVEKTPMHLRFIPLIERLSANERRTHFVHVIRNGLDVVASLHAASLDWERTYDLETCVRRWNEDVRFSLGRVSSSCDHIVFYEELTSNPEATLRQLFHELNLEWEPEILERFGAVSDGLKTKEEFWKADFGSVIRPSGTSQCALTQPQRDGVSASLRHDLYERLFRLAQARPRI